ncbi:hypothetical protein Golax_022520, partial [Gossypium laxum]|nr:hypothetical protein [Gossypium laxum]
MEEYDLNLSPFWVRISNIPMELMDRKMAMEPLRRVVHYVDKEGVELVCAIRYERLPRFCYICRLIGHTTQKCVKKEASKLKQLIVANNPDIIFLCETKMNAIEFQRVQTRCRIQKGLTVNSEYHSGGLAMMWKDE